MRCHTTGRERCGLVAGEDAAFRLRQVGVVVAQVKRERFPAEGEADIPGQIAGVGNTARESRNGIEGITGPELPIADVTRQRSADAGRQPSRRSDEGYVARIVNQAAL